MDACKRRRDVDCPDLRVGWRYAQHMEFLISYILENEIIEVGFPRVRSCCAVERDRSTKAGAIAGYEAFSWSKNISRDIEHSKQMLNFSSGCVRCSPRFTASTYTR
jgi:hypothetical protein